MRRSEMIQKMTDVIEKLYGQDRYNYKVAKDILEMQEKEGMLPPRGELDASQMHLLNTTMKVPHLWESEE